MKKTAQGFGFGGRPPSLPFALTAAVLAADLTFPPLRPSATAAGFLRGTAFPVVAVDVTLREFRDALQRQLGDLQREGLEGGDVAGSKGGVSLRHQLAARGVHGRNIAKRLGYVKW